MIDSKFLDASYYQKKLPIYLQNSYGVDEHFNIFWNVLTALDSSAESLLNALDIYSSAYSTNPKGYDNPMLDKLASFYGVSREMTLHYRYNDQDVSETVKLTNYELLTLIKCLILNNAYNGSYEDLMDLYKDKVGLRIVYVASDTKGYVNVYANQDDIVQSDYPALQHLFLSGMLLVKSLGLIYTPSPVVFGNIGLWDSETQGIWDVSIWS